MKEFKVLALLSITAAIFAALSGISIYYATMNPGIVIYILAALMVGIATEYAVASAFYIVNLLLDLE